MADAHAAPTKPVAPALEPVPDGASRRDDAPASGGRARATGVLASAPGAIGTMLGLQGAAGNRAVVQLIQGRARPATHGSRRALAVQRDVGGVVDPKMRVQILRNAISFQPILARFEIDLGKATEALTGLTKADGRAIRQLFESQEDGRNLAAIIGGYENLEPGGFEFGNNLGKGDRTKLLLMLQGDDPKPNVEIAKAEAMPEPTAEPAPAGSEPGPAAPAGGASGSPLGPAVPAATPAVPTPAPTAAPAPVEPRIRLAAATLRAALDHKDAEAAIAAIPATEDDRRALEPVYRRMFGQGPRFALMEGLPKKQAQRAMAIWRGDPDAADRLALEIVSDERDAAKGLADKVASLGGVGSVGDEVNRRLLASQQKLEAQVKRIAQSSDQTTAMGKAAGRERLQKVLASDPNGKLAKRVGVGSNAIIDAIAEGNEADEIGARLARADATKDVSAAEIEAAIRQVRRLADDSADLTIDLQPDAFEPVREYITKAVITGYYDRFRKSFDATQKRRPFDALIAGRGGTDEKAAKFVGLTVDEARELTGKTADINRNKALLARGGELDEWGELFFALTRKPKDLDRVREILGSKTNTQVTTLAELYATKSGRSLERDLAGTELEQQMASYWGGEAKEGLAEKRELLMGSQFDRELAEKRIPGGGDPDEREASLLAAEGQFLFSKIRGLERRVLENRGAFARVRDWAGNEEKELLDLARKDAVEASRLLGRAVSVDRGTTWDPGEENMPTVDLALAQKQVFELRRIDARLTHAVSIYKEATAKAFDEFVDLAVTIASTAAGLGAVGIWITAARTTAATIGTKLLLKGNDYSVDEFIADVQGGLAGVAGDFAKLGVKSIAAPWFAGKLARMARKLGVSKEFYARVEKRLGPLALRQAEHTFGTATSNVLEGKSVLEGQGAGARFKGEIQGQVTGAIEDAYFKKPPPAGGDVAEAPPPPGADEQYGPVRRTDTGDDAGAPAREPAPTPPVGAQGDEPGPSTVDDASPPPTPRVSMALEPSPRPRNRPAPPTEPPPARPQALGALTGADHMDAPRTEAGAEPPRPAKRSRRPKPVAAATETIAPASPHAAEPVGDSGDAAPKAMDYPAGTQLLNAPATPVASRQDREKANQAALHPRAQSEERRRAADEAVRKAEDKLRRVRSIGIEQGPMWNSVMTELRQARATQAVVHGRRPPTDKELARLNTTEQVADAEAEYAAARQSETWKARETAQELHAGAVAEHNRAKAALEQAKIAAGQGADGSDASTASGGAPKALETAKADLEAAGAALAASKQQLDAAHAADWRSRRAWSGLKYARRQRDEAHGKPVPPPIPAAALKGPGRPVEGPAQHEDFPPHLWDRELVIQLANATSLREHEALVFKMLHEDLSREVGLFRNNKTGEWIVVRGKEKSVVVESDPGSGNERGGSGPKGAGEVQRWKELLGKDSDTGDWELIAHSHPTTPGQLVARISQYPSAYGGDFSVLRRESEDDGGKPKASTIYYMDGNIRQKTEFGYNPNHFMPYWIKMPGEPELRFQTMHDYQEHMKQALAPYGPGNQPKHDPIPPGYVEKFGMEGVDDEPE